MEAILSVFSSRHEIHYLETGEPFTKEIFREPYYSLVSISLKNDDGVFANLSIDLLDNAALLNDGYSVMVAADEVDVDISHAILSLESEGIYPDNLGELDQNKMFLALHWGYIREISVAPEYRGQGYAKYLLDNLEDILLYTLSAQLYWVTSFPRADGESVENPGENTQKLIRLLESRGFQKLGERNVYARNYAADTEEYL